MHRNLRHGLNALSLVLIVAIAGSGMAAGQAEPNKPPVAAAGPWQAATEEPFRVEVTLDGVYEAAQMWPVKVDLQEWLSLEVAEPVALGKPIKQGQPLLRIDTTKIDKSIQDSATALESSRLALQQTQIELQALETTTPMDLAAADRVYDRAMEDHQRFLKIDHPMALRSAELTLKGSHEMLEYTQEELRQLEKMYAEDELTEETEEIILKRQRRAVERGTFSLEQSKIANDRVLKITFPRTLFDAENQIKRAILDRDRARKTLPLKLEGQKRAAAKMENDFKQSEEKLSKLRADRALMDIKSPADGLVYYGPCQHGRWTQAAMIDAAMIPGGSLKGGSVILTVVQPRPLVVRANVAEGQLARVIQGISGLGTPVAFANQSVPVKVSSVESISLSGQYEVLLESADPGDSVMPGMNVRLKLTSYDNPKALTIPLEALQTDEAGQSYVWIKNPEGQEAKQVVKAGWRGDRKIEILEGLAAGQEVRLGDPGATAKPTPGPNPNAPKG